MSGTPRTRIEPEPSYPCCNCYEEYSWNFADLRWYKNDLWCANCFDALDEDGERMLWSDLEPFIPKADRELAGARAEIEKQAKLIESMKNCQNCGRTGGFCRHCRYAPDKRGWDDNWKEPI